MNGILILKAKRKAKVPLWPGCFKIEIEMTNQE
jgi:hypothetical protein